MGSGGLPKLAIQNTARAVGGAAGSMGSAYGPAESAVSMARTFYTHKQRLDALRKSIRRAHEEWLRIRRALQDARADVDEARSAVDSAVAAIQELKTQFPRWFRDL